MNRKLKSLHKQVTKVLLPLQPTWPAVVIDIMLGGNGEFKAKQQLRFKGYPEEVINEAVGYAQTEDTQVLKAREEYRKLVEHFTEQSKEGSRRSTSGRGSVYYWYRASRIPSY